MSSGPGGSWAPWRRVFGLDLVLYRMVRNPRFDVAEHLAGLTTPVFGIDLHWLPHPNGALGIAALVKQLHPEAKLVVNPLSFMPADLDWVDVPAYDFMTHAVFKYRSLADVLPYLEWLRYSSTMLLNSRGCTYECAICDGSRTGYRVVAATHDRGARHFAIATETFPKVDAIAVLEEPERRWTLRELAAQVSEANTASLVGEHELEWKTTAGLRVSRVLARHTAAALPRELSHGLARLAGRYDTAVARVPRLPAPRMSQVGATHHPDGDGPAGRRRGDLDHDDAPVDAGRRAQEPRTR